MEILNVGIGELLFIFIIALLIFGPERLPELARQFAKVVAQVRGATDEIQRALLSETQPLRKTFEETQRELQATAKPLTDVREQIEATANPLKQGRRELDKQIEAVKQPFKPRTPAAPRVEATAPVEPAPPNEATPTDESDPTTGQIREPQAYKPVARGEVVDDHE